MVLVDGQLAPLRVLRAQHRGHRDDRRRRVRRRVAEPGRAAREPREVGEAALVDHALLVEQRDDRELVEEDEHDRRVRLDGREAHVHVGREDEPRHGRVEEEEPEEDERRGGEDGQERARRRHAREQEGGADAGQRRERDQDHRPVHARALERLDGDDGGEEAEEDEVEDLGRAPAGEADDELDREHDERRHEGHGERERDDVERRRAAHREELRVLAEDVEERLREREAGGCEELGASDRGLAQARAVLHGLVAPGCLGGGHAYRGRAA